MRTQWHFRTLTGTLAGYLIWGTYFVLIYSLMSVACRYGLAWVDLLGVNVINLTLGVITVITLGAIGGLALGARRAQRQEQEAQVEFLIKIALLSDLISLVGTVWVGAAVLFVEPCL